MSDRKRPGCYQCGDDDLEAVQARRREEIRAWAAADQAHADEVLTGVPLVNSFGHDVATQEIPEEQDVPEVTNEHEIPANSEADLTVDATAKAAADQDADADAEEKADDKEPAKKAAPKKAVAHKE